MPNWSSAADKTGQGLISGTSFGGGNGKLTFGSGGGRRSVSRSLKKSLDSTGAGLLQGVHLKKEPKLNITRFPSSTWRDDPYEPSSFPSHIRPGGARPHISTVATTLVHDIPCFDLPPQPKASPYAEATLWDRIKWNKTLKENKHLEISLPINLLTFEETQTRRESAYNEVAKYVDIGYITAKPPLRVDVTNLKRQYTVRDASPPPAAPTHNFNPAASNLRSDPNYIYCRFCPGNIPVNGDLCAHLEKCGCGNIQFTSRGVVAAKMSKTYPTDPDFAYCCPSSAYLPSPVSAESTSAFEQHKETEMSPAVSPISARRVQYPSMRKIPEDLPCHERYTALSRSRSTRAIISQNVWTAESGAGDEGADKDEREYPSEASSMYSRDERQEQDHSEKE